MFKSFFMGGFESATHCRRDRTRIDVVHATGHGDRCADDYRLLIEAGILTVRDGLRWHLIETSPGVFDWTSLLPMLCAARQTGVQVIWDLCHWGVPDGLDPFAEEFPSRFAAFAGAAARFIRSENESAGIFLPSFYCPINEISFWSWVGGDLEHFSPYGSLRGPELKRQLVLASVAAVRRIREEDPAAHIVQAEPIIHISADKRKPEDAEEARGHTASQFEAWDMLAGLRNPELGGDADMLDVIGVNYYWNNQWIHEGDRTPPGHDLHQPLHAMLERLWERYRRPIVITETGAEAAAGVGWLGYIAAETRQAQRAGVPVLGICLYPVMDYPGWDDHRHCQCGLIAVERDWSKRHIRQDLLAELRAQQLLVHSFDHTAKTAAFERPRDARIRNGVAAHRT